MPVSLPTSADVRKAREHAAKTAAERAELARTPLLAVLGAGDRAVTAVSKAVADARTRAGIASTRAAERAEGVQHRVAELPQRLSGEELRKVVAELRAQAERTYAEFAKHGEATWGRIRTQPQVKEAFAKLDAYSGKLDARVDEFVNEAHDAAEKALTTVSTQTRSTGERVARAAQRFTGRTAEAVSGASQDASTTVGKAGAEVAEQVKEAGDGVAHETRSATRKAANRTAPKVESTNTARKPAARRTSNGGKTSS